MKNSPNKEIKKDKKNKLSKIEKKKKFSTLNYFTERLLSKVTHGTLDIQGSSFEVSYSKIMSESHKKRVIQILEYPTYIFVGHLEKIRQEAIKLFPKEDAHKVSVNIIEHCIPNKIYFGNNKKIRSLEKNFRRQLIDLQTQINRKFVQLYTGTNIIGGDRDDIQLLAKRLERLERKVFSFSHINSHQNSGGEVVKAYIFLEVTGETLKLTDEIADKVMNLLNLNNYKYKEVTSLIPYLNSFGVSSLDYSKKMKWDSKPVTLTSDISSATQTYSEGIIRSKSGDVYLGHSIETIYPVHISFSESSKASNVLLVAESGSGKTVFAKNLALGALNHKGNTYNCIVTDFKGGEWSPIVRALNRAEEISMGIENPKFVNTLAIPDYKQFGFSNPEASYYLSAGYTVKLLSTLVGMPKDELLRTKIQNVCNDIVGRVYLVNGISPEKPSSFINSKKINFADSIWEAINYVTTSSSDMEARHGKEILSTVKTSLEYYFTATGSKRYMFNNSINIDELMDKKFIVFDYGANTAGGQGALLEKEIHSKILQKNFFTTLYSSKMKLNDQYTIEIEEEVQRQLSDPMLIKELNDKITGGRSSNRSTIVITNTVTALLESKMADVTAIRENITTVIIGRVKEEVANQTIKYFGLEKAKSRVTPILTGNQFNNCFFLAFNTGKVFDMCVVKTLIPKNILDSEIFESRKIES